MIKPYDWDAAGYRDCRHCHGGFPLEQMMGDICKWCDRAGHGRDEATSE